MVTFTEEILNGKLDFCAVKYYVKVDSTELKTFYNSTSNILLNCIYLSREELQYTIEKTGEFQTCFLCRIWPLRPLNTWEITAQLFRTICLQKT